MNTKLTNPAPVTLDGVLARVREACAPLPTERVSLPGALGRILREPVRALEDQPPFDRSAMDGYAVRIDDPGPEFAVVDGIRAGEWKPQGLERGEAVQIGTGAALPSEGLRVVMKEDAQVSGKSIRVIRRDPDRHIRFRGEDARSGDVLVDSGTVLTAGAIGLLASLGEVEPVVTRLPRVLHVVTGDEIVPPDQVLADGQIRDSNSSLVRAFLNQWRIEPRQLRTPEDEEAARKALANARLDTIDLFLVSGGASVGRHDFTRPLLEHLGYRLEVSKTSTRPGKPLVFATGPHGTAFGLPGNPLAHFVCLNLYVRAALEGFQTLPSQQRFVSGRLTADLRSAGGRRETLWPAGVEVTERGLAITPLPWKSSGDLTALARANALVRVPADAERLSAGSEVSLTLTQTLT